MSSTAPTSMSSSSTSSFSGRWLSPAGHLSLRGGGADVAPPPAAADAAPSGNDYLVADMADAMFNSGTNSGNNGTMESLFPLTENKWGEEKLNK